MNESSALAEKNRVPFSLHSASRTVVVLAELRPTGLMVALQKMPDLVGRPVLLSRSQVLRGSRQTGPVHAAASATSENRMQTLKAIGSSFTERARPPLPSGLGAMGVSWVLGDRE